MATTKIKAPPKRTGAEVLALLKLTSDRKTLGYATKMANLINFIHLTADIRIGAEVVEHDLNIEQDGNILRDDYMKRNFIDDKMRSVKFHVEDENELYGNLNKINREISELSKITHSKAKVNTDEKKEKAQKKIDELKVLKDEAQSALNELREKIEGLKAEERKKLEATDFPIQEMREKFMLFTGCKIRIDLTTGSYTFPVPVGTPFYREVCNLLKLPLPEQEAAEKPVIKRMFTVPADAFDAIKRAMKFVSGDDLRPAMTCVSIEITDNRMLVVATDAHRLFKSREFEVSGPPGSHTYLLPATSLKRLPRAVSEDLSLYELKGEKVSFCGITVDLMDARYPDWKVVMPDYDPNVYVSFNRLDLMEATKEVGVYSNKSTNQVTYNFNGEIMLTAQDVDFSFESSRRMRYVKKTMPDLMIAFNGRFLSEALSTFKSEELILQASTPTKAAIFTDGVDEILIMPLMLNC
jgi:hypothetical protein